MLIVLVGTEDMCVAIVTAAKRFGPITTDQRERR